MQFPTMDEDDGDFASGAATRSRLSSLFQNEGASADVNQALTFTAPKQPKKNDGTQPTSGALKLFHAVVVHAYKLKDGNYVTQGKLGCAILGQHENYTYKLLLYKGKQVQVTFCTISPSFSFHIQPNNYATFCDEKKENWSLYFESEVAITEFCQQVALAKANSQGKSITSLVTQDLVLGAGSSLEQNDSAEVKYSGWLFQNFTFGQMFDSNMNTDATFRIKLGKSKVIKGWSEGLQGCQKGGKRALIVPPNLAYGSEGMGSTVPPNSTLIFLIHVVKVKSSHEKSYSPSPIKISDNVGEKKPDVPPRQSFSQEDNIRMRGASISEQLSQSPKKDKAQLISRMAKMGTATLPLQGAVPAQVSSDSETEDELPPETSPVPVVSSSRTSSPKAFTKPRSRTNSGNKNIAVTQPTQPVQPQSIQGNAPFHVSQHSSQVSLYAQAAVPFQQPYTTPATTFPTYQPQMSGQYQSPFPLSNIPGMMPGIPASVADAHLPMLLTETRSYNSEVRMSLSKITDKVDTVLQKVDDLRSQGRSPSSTHVPFMESSILMQNIERIIQENSRLKEDIETKNNKIQALNEKICDLFQRNQRFFEESSNMLEQRSDSMQAASSQSHAKVLSLEQQTMKLSSELSEATGKLTALETELEQRQKKEAELQKKILEMERESKRQEELLNEAKERVNDAESELNSLKDELKNVKHEKRLLSTKLENVDEKFQELQETKDSLEKLLSENQKKLQDVKSKMEEELSEIRKSHEQEILVYQDKLKRKPSIADVNPTEQNADEVNTLRKELEEILKEKDNMQLNYQTLQKRVHEYEKNATVSADKLQEMKTELENSLVWKKKYEVFYEKTRALKDRYENQIIELMTEVKQLQSVRSVTTSPDFAAEIKKVMNILYKLLQGKFEANTPYTGSKVLEMTLQAIRGLTMQMLEMKKRSASASSEKTDENEKSIENSSSNNVSNSGNITEGTTAQQNGISETVSHELNSNVVDTPSNSNVNSTDESSLAPESKESDPHTDKLEHKIMGDNSEISSAHEMGDSSSLDGIQNNVQIDPTKNKKVETNERDSPESSVPLPTSDTFADTLSETEKPKSWRPQPPPLFDDDDEEDEDDDDWLK
ncbi:FK506-binding protein 15-like isoform X1 [Uloborus diversus]|uniref:FK506-binding protein 15-like isoform X1 n=1 Tax=Uloborus diversus TaxID=327109 RepID=UPI002409182E|nr:FK506-binding protein 15-like isoform X1 [Uloborus diversus]